MRWLLQSAMYNVPSQLTYKSSAPESPSGPEPGWAQPPKTVLTPPAYRCTLQPPASKTYSPPSPPMQIAQGPRIIQRQCSISDHLVGRQRPHLP
eukprot:4154673-Amphidinium_carterae.1